LQLNVTNIVTFKIFIKKEIKKEGVGRWTGG